MRRLTSMSSSSSGSTMLHRSLCVCACVCVWKGGRLLDTGRLLEGSV